MAHKDPYRGNELKDVGLRIDPVAYRALKQFALDIGDVPAAQVIRDILYLWLGYAIHPDDPVYSRLGELPGVVEMFPGYVARIDMFGAKTK